MKLILDDINKIEVDLEEPEITIVDKKNEKRAYVIYPKGGYMLIRHREPYKVFDVDMNTTIELINIETTPDYIIKNIQIGDV